MVVLLSALLGLCIVSGIVLLRVARTLRAETGLPAGRVVSADTGAWQPCDRALFSKRYGLVGKPDYLVRQGRAVVPVEVKPRRNAAAPYLSDVLQLAAYCLLVEETYRRAPPHGLLRYASQTFQVDFTPELRRHLLGVLNRIRGDEAVADVRRNHESPARCERCGYRGHCDQRLA